MSLIFCVGECAAASKRLNLNIEVRRSADVMGSQIAEGHDAVNRKH
jgi:hypothetical protein